MIEQTRTGAEGLGSPLLRAPISATERKALMALMNQYPVNSKDIWTAYKFEYLDLPPNHQQLLLTLAEYGERAKIRPIGSLTREFIDVNIDRLSNLVARFGEISAGLIAGFGHFVFTEYLRFEPYIAGLLAQGKTTAAATFSVSPAEWIPDHAAKLLEIREHFGVCCLPVFTRLQEIYPAGWNDQLEGLFQCLGYSGLGLLAREGEKALECAIRHKSVIEELREICEQSGRPDAFIASVEHLYAELLERHSSEIIALAQTNPGKLPEILSKLHIQDLEERLPLVFDAARYAKSSIAATVDSLHKLAAEEHSFASRLIAASGIFADRALNFRGPALLIENRARQEELLSEYGHAYWGLAERHLDKLHQAERAHYDFIQRARDATNIGAGRFFASLPIEHWNDTGLRFAERYQNAAGHIIKDHGENFLKFEHDQHIRRLFEQNREYFNLRWVNRYTRLHLGELDTTLLERNIANLTAPALENQPIALFISGQTDPLNTFSGRHYYRLLHEVGSKAKLFIAEFAHAEEIGEMMRRICEDPRYGGSINNPRTIDLLMIAAHSDGYSMQGSGVRHVLPATASEAESLREQYLGIDDGELIASWGRYMSAPSRGILFACSAFKQHGGLKPIGKVFEERLPDTTFDGLTRVGNFHGYELGENGIPHTIYWRDGYTWR